jgi:hypothetical protein
MKKIASLFLLSIFLFNTVGYYIAFKTVQLAVKKEIKSQIKSNLAIKELTMITINKTDLSTIDWKDGGKEMVYKDEMYDIVRTTETPVSITYYCINDRKEKALFANLDEHINAHISADKPLKNSGSKKLVEHVVKLYFCNEPMLSFNINETGVLFFLTPIKFPSVFIEINSPPPEFV